MSQRVPVILVGAGGYGASYLRRLLNPECAGHVAGIVEPFPHCVPAELQAAATAAGVSWWPTVAAALAASNAPLIVISSPIPYHAEQAIAALAARRNVLLEKPVAGTVADGFAIAAAAKIARGFCSIGFQWSFDPAMITLRALARSGALGQPLRLATCTRWPRPPAYFVRNDWVGRLRNSAGQAVNDSPISNACAHHLHNALLLASDAGWRPAALRAELLRRNPIETFDAAALSFHSVDGALVEHYSAHCTAEYDCPQLDYRFTKARIVTLHDGSLELRWNDGRSETFPAPDGHGHEFRKLDSCALACRDGTIPPSPVSECLLHLQAVAAAPVAALDINMWSAQDPSPTDPGAPRVWPGLNAAMLTAFAHGGSLHQHGLSIPAPAPAMRWEPETIS